MSETPRTNAEEREALLADAHGSGFARMVDAEFARQLERELAAAHDAIRGFVYDEVSDKESWAKFKACLDGSKD